MKRLVITLILAMFLMAGCVTEVAVEPPPFVVDTGVDPYSWALVPAGEFIEGLNEHVTMVGYDYEIMVTDVTNAQFAEYLNDALAAGTVKIEERFDEDGESIQVVVGEYPGDVFNAYSHEVEITAGWKPHMKLNEPLLLIEFNGETFSAIEGYEDHPMVLVTWFGANAYCQFYDGRLPTEIEWEKAARGTDNRAFPWGDEIERNNANYYSSHDLFEKLFAGLGSTTPVGFYNGSTYEGYETLDSASPYGLYDMAGNVWQWTGDVYEDTHLRYLRGGSRSEYAYNLRVWTSNNAGPDYYGPNVGFRCARDVAE